MMDGGITDEILVKCLLGEATDAEHTGVQVWLSRHVENQKYFDDIKLVWEQSHSLGVATAITADESWLKFKRRINEAAVSGAVIVPANHRKWLKIAAALIFIVGGGWLYSLYIKSNKNVQLVSKVNIPVILKQNGINNAAGYIPINIPAYEREKAKLQKQLPAHEAKIIVGKPLNYAAIYKKTAVGNNMGQQNKQNELFCRDNHKYHGPQYDSNF
jgi:hypothetical protein